MKKFLFEQGKRYSFGDYFNMGNPSEEIIAELGYRLSQEEIVFPRAATPEAA